MTNLDIEKIGTEIVTAYEKTQGREIFRPKYKGCGYDLCTGNNKETRYIEIKTTRSKKLTGRWLEKAGYNQLQMNPDFYVYGVTDIKDEGTGILTIYTAADITIEEDIKYVMKFEK
jgi:hypothetical protein